ncbi:MAG TPA: HD-GYP domain-containing protein, partial [Acidimicrobiales bacterium]|nr:HD-GYP domain-containing protein [Acidimicrobiales bacterium]
MENERSNAWAAHRWWARAMRAVVFGLPVAVALGTSYVASRLFPEPAGLAWAAAWWVGLLAMSTGMLVVVERQARHLMPLATLLKLSLVFPDRVPSRWRTAMRIGATSQLERRLAEAKAGGRPGETLSQAATRVLELAAALSVHDRATRGHAERVRAYTNMIGKQMGLSAHDIDKLNWAALLHDIGKLGIPGEILNKRSSLSAAETDVVRGHPEIGWRLLGPLREWLGPWAGAVREHHERWDGNGYPRHLRGAQISLAARIVAVADCFDVMTSARSYKRPVSFEAARRELTACAGGQFDPAAVRAMLAVSLGRLWPVMGPLTWVAQIPLLGTASPMVLSAVVSTAGRAFVVAT